MSRESDEIVGQIISAWQKLVDNKPSSDALLRLKTRTDALVAWHKLWQKAEDNKPWPDALDRLLTRTVAHVAGDLLQKRPPWQRVFYTMVNDMVRYGFNAYLKPSSKKTAREIKEAGLQAEKLAKKLAKLIEDNKTLSVRDEELLSKSEQATRSQLLQGLSMLRATSEEPTDIDFDRKVYIEMMYPRQSLPEKLRRFARIARNSCRYKPLVPRPKMPGADEHYFAVSACERMNFWIGSPNIEIAAALTSAAFDKDVDRNTVKSWWQRRGYRNENF